MRVRFLAAAVLAVILAAGCATVPPSQRDDRVAALVDLINAGQVDEIVAQSQVPFLFQSELAVRSSDVRLIWQRLKDEGILFTAAPGDARPAAAGDYMTIDNRFDLQVFFSPEGHLPPDAMWIGVDSRLGAFELLIGGAANRLPLILGLVRVAS